MNVILETKVLLDIDILITGQFLLELKLNSSEDEAAH